MEKDIIRIEKVGNTTLLVFSQGEVSESLLDINELESTLSKKGFVRIHPNHLINKSHLKNKFDLMTEWITLDNGEKLPSNYVIKKNKNTIRDLFRRLFFIQRSISSI